MQESDNISPGENSDTSSQDAPEKQQVDVDADVGQYTQNYIEAYHAVAEWIRFADAKAAVILTVGGAMAGLLIPTIHNVVGALSDAEHLVPFWQTITISLFVLYILFFLLSGIYAFLCINPFRQRGRHPALDHCDHFHPAAIASRYKRNDCELFIKNCKANGEAELLNEVLAAILLDSHISTRKYDFVKISLKLFATSVFFGFAYFLVLQF